MTTLVVTGATGYVGRALVRAAQKRGIRIVAASRRRPATPAEWIRYDLADAVDPAILPDGATLVHLAAETRASSEATDTIEIDAAMRLVEASRVRRSRIIFVSSQAARKDAPTRYGRIKWRIESLVLGAGGSVVRPGLVYGGAPGGVFADLLQLVQRMPLLPALWPAPHVQPIHVDDLAAALIAIAERSDAGAHAYNLGAAVPITFTAFLRVLARMRLRRLRPGVPVPFACVNAAMAVARLFGRSVDPDRVRSLRELPVMHTAADMAALDVVLRPLRSGMCASGDDRRRQLLREAHALLGYVLRERPGSSVCRRYVRAVERMRGAQPLALPRTLTCWPLLLALVDRREDTAENVELQWRLDAAVVLAEATPAGARRLLPRRESPLLAVACVGAALAGEAFWRMAGFFARPLLMRSMTRPPREP